MAEAGQQTVREAVGVFLDRDSFQNAVEDLMSAGFDRAELSRLAGEQAVEEKLGHADRRVQELEDEPSAPRAVYIGNHSLAERTGVIGGLAYIGAVVGAAPWSPPAVRSRLRSRRRRWSDRRPAGALPGPRLRPGAAETAGSGRAAALGARARPGARAAGARDPEFTSCRARAIPPTTR